MAYFRSNVSGGIPAGVRTLPTVDTASGAIATFNTDLTENLVEVKCQIVAQQASGTPSPDNPLPITTYTEMNLVHYDENLFISMPTATNDGITTSYDSNTGLISITNDSRTTNYGYGSQRGIVASGLNPSHTYKFVFYPNVLGVTLYDTSSLAIPNPFTGYTTVVLRITNQYDFVNVHPIGDITTVRLFIFDLTDGYGTTANIPFGQTVANGVLDITTGKLRVTWNEVDLGDLYWVYISDNQLFSTNISGKKPSIEDGMVSHYANGGWWSGWTDKDYVWCGNANNTGFVVKDTRFTNATSFKNGVRGAKFVYELATPIDIQLDSITLQALLNENNVWCDTGDTEVKFLLTVGKKIS